MSVEKMIAFGGKDWNGKRVYFNGEVAYKAIGLTCENYKSGQIKNATLNGEKISNNKAFGIAKDFYFDIEKQTFVGNKSEIVVQF